MMEFWTGVGAGFGFGWAAATVLALVVIRYDRSRGYDRARQHNQQLRSLEKAA